MPLPRRSFVALALPVLAAALSTAGCHRPCFSSLFASSDRTAAGSPQNSGVSGNASAPAPTSGDATRAIAEADIVQLDPARNWLYTIAKSGELSVIDASQPRTLDLLGQTTLHGTPFEMYRRPSALLVLANQAVLGDGSLAGTYGDVPDATRSALLQALDLSDPASPKVLGTFQLPGEIADSRVVGDVLYVATYENAACYGCTPGLRTVVSSFDISQPASPRAIDRVSFVAPNAAAVDMTTTALPWKRSIVATGERLYVGGLAEPTSTAQGVVDVLDISDPGGHLVRGAHLAVAGPVLSRWQMDEWNGTFRVVSQHGAALSINGDANPAVDTFRIDSTASFAPLGHTSLSVSQQEGLKTVRFDGPRAYAVTFPATQSVQSRGWDPLFTIDLSDPANPRQRGALEIPGWSYHIVPRGDRLVAIGLDRTNGAGQLTVSLFDVADMKAPSLLSRVSFGSTQAAAADETVTQTMLAEDQDRIQKAFRVFDDGLIAVPFSDPGSTGDACTSGRSGVQLVEWTPSSLSLGALLPVPGNPRRALRRDSSTTKELLAISDSDVVAFDIAQRQAAVPNASVKIGECVTRQAVVPPASGPAWGTNAGGDRAYGYDDVVTDSCE